MNKEIKLTIDDKKYILNLIIDQAINVDDKKYILNLIIDQAINVDDKKYILNLIDQAINDLLKQNSPVYFRHDNNVHKYKGSLDEFEKEIAFIYQKISKDPQRKNKKDDTCKLVDSIFADLLDHTKEATKIELNKPAERVSIDGHPDKYRKAAKQFSKDELNTLNIKEQDIIQFDKFDKLEFDDSSEVSFDSKEELNCDEKNKKPSDKSKSNAEKPVNNEESKDESFSKKPKSCSFFSGDMF